MYEISEGGMSDLQALEEQRDTHGRRVAAGPLRNRGSWGVQLTGRCPKPPCVPRLTHLRLLRPAS